MGQRTEPDQGRDLRRGEHIWTTGQWGRSQGCWATTTPASGGGQSAKAALARAVPELGKEGRGGAWVLSPALPLHPLMPGSPALPPPPPPSTQGAWSAVLGVATCGFSRNVPAPSPWSHTRRRVKAKDGSPERRSPGPRASEAAQPGELTVPSFSSHPARQGICHWTICLGKGEPPGPLRPVLTEMGQPSGGARVLASHSPRGPGPK